MVLSKSSGVPSILQSWFFACKCICVFRAPYEGILQYVEVSRPSGDHGRDLQGPNKLICQHVVGEEGHQVVGEANNIDTPTQKDGQDGALQISVSTIEKLERESVCEE